MLVDDLCHRLRHEYKSVAVFFSVFRSSVFVLSGRNTRSTPEETFHSTLPYFPA